MGSEHANDNTERLQWSGHNPHEQRSFKESTRDYD